ncbi:MAG: IgGFc-binding protein [Polyangiaceae bacterium]
MLLSSRTLGAVLGIVLATAAACGSDADAPPGSVASGGSAGAGAGSGGAAGSGGSAGTGAGGGTGGAIEIDGGVKKCPRCSDDLHAIIGCDGKVQQACLGSDGCDTDTITCTNACAAAESARRSVGCEYYAVQMDQLNAQGCFAVFVANTWNAPAKLTVEYQGQQLPLSTFAYTPVGWGPTLSYAPIGPAGLTSGKVAILFLAGPDGTPAKDTPVCPRPAAIPGGTMLANKTGIGHAFRITSDVPVVAYQINPYGGGFAAVTGSSLLIPTSAWDTEYLAIHAYDSGPHPTSMNIVAKEPTTIKMLPTNNIKGGNGLAPGSAYGDYTVTLNAGEHVQFTQLLSLGGTTIQADKPVGFLAGARCSQVPTDVYACDHLEQMIPPIQALGNEYVGVSHQPRSGEPALWRVMGVVEGTQLTYSADVGGPVQLKQGQIIQFSTTFPFAVKSQDKDHPFLLMAHMTGGSTKGMIGIGDAEAVLSVPPAQFLTEYVFFTDPTYPITNLVVVRAPEEGGGFSEVNLDCAGTLTGWKPVGKYEYTRLNLTEGDFQGVGTCSSGAHRMYSSGKFGLYVWGWGSPGTSVFTEYVSYGYPAGMNIQRINQVALPR